MLVILFDLFTKLYWKLLFIYKAIIFAYYLDNMLQDNISIVIT